MPDPVSDKPTMTRATNSKQTHHLNVEANYNYQAKLIQEAWEHLKRSGGCVLGAAPSSGKSEMAALLCERYLEAFPGSKILFLAHGQSILRKQFHEKISRLIAEQRITRPFSFAAPKGYIDAIGETDLTIALPQGFISHLPPGQVDLLVVDEAHHYYHAKLVQSIIEHYSPKHQLLLTGTPSPFIETQEWPIVFHSVQELFEAGVVSDPYSGLIESTYDYALEQYNEDFELKESMELNTEQTRATLDQVLGYLSSLDRGDNAIHPIRGEALPLESALGAGKVFVACHDQKQASDVHLYFKDRSISCALSTCDTDVGSAEIQRFISDPRCKILVVVYRGILGFDLPSITDIFDLTGSLNPNRIFQLFCRLIRKHPALPRKRFFKVMPARLSLQAGVTMCFTMGLTQREIYETYDGHYLSTSFRLPNAWARAVVRVVQAKRKGLPEPVVVLPELPTMVDLMQKKQGPFHETKEVTLSEIRGRLAGRTRYLFTDDELMAIAKKYSKRRDFDQHDHLAYRAAFRRGKAFFDKCTVHMAYHFYSDEEILKVARKYKTIRDWNNHSLNTLAIARNRGEEFFKKCTAHMTVLRRHWTNEELLSEALKYSSRREWATQSGASFQAAQLRGDEFYKKCTAHMGPPLLRYWEDDEILAEAKRFRRPIDWHNGSRKSHKAAQARGREFYQRCIAHMAVNEQNWTEDELLRIAKQFRSRVEWTKRNSGSQQAAVYRGKEFYEKCCAHMKTLHHDRYTDEELLEIASRYETKTDFVTGARSVYYVALSRGPRFFRRCTAHMKSARGRRRSKRAA